MSNQLSMSIISVILISVTLLVVDVSAHIARRSNDGALVESFNIQQILREGSSYLSNLPIVRGDQEVVGKPGCKCIGYNCGCCGHIYIPEVHLNHTVCVNASYLPDEYGISLTVTLDNRVLANVTVSAKNPPPICIGIPYLKKEASLCVDLYNLTYAKTSFSGCARLEARIIFIKVKSVDLGCFSIPLHSVKEQLKAKVMIQKLNVARGYSKN